MKDSNRGTMVKRQWRLLQFLSTRRYVTLTATAEKFEVSVKTVRRDIAVLAEVGFPIYTKRNPEGESSFVRVDRDYLNLVGSR